MNAEQLLNKTLTACLIAKIKLRTKGAAFVANFSYNLASSSNFSCLRKSERTRARTRQNALRLA